MKKALSIILCAALVLATGIIGAAAADENSANIDVTITDESGNIVVAAETVAVADTDGDGALTITDALYCAHEAFYEGGASAGYATKKTEYGLSLDKLWGNANGGSYGYYVNGASAWSLTDPVKEDDYLYAFIYTDLVGWSDKFSSFDQFKGDVDAAQGVELTLSYVAEYDESYMPVFKPLAGADILIDGEPSGFKTDDNGKAKITFDKNGVVIVSAVSSEARITPPVFKATVTGAPEPIEAPTDDATEAPTEPASPDEVNNNPNAIQTGASGFFAYLMLFVLLMGFAFILLKKGHEK